MVDRQKIFFDTEFTGLHQNTTLISIGLVSEDGQKLYCELDDFDLSQVDKWIQENVVRHLWIRKPEISPPVGVDYAIGNLPDIAKVVSDWLSQWDSVEMWSDCYAYDWTLFNNLFGGAFEIPDNVYYIPFDLSTLLWANGVDPDVNREEFAGVNGGDKHNALHDAIVIKKCFEKLTEEK